MNPFKDNQDINRDLKKMNRLKRDPVKKRASWAAIEDRTSQLSRWGRVRRKLLAPVVMVPLITLLAIIIIIPMAFDVNDFSTSDRELIGDETRGGESISIEKNKIDVIENEVETFIVESDEMEDKESSDMIASEPILPDTSIGEFYQTIQEGVDIDEESKQSIMSWLGDLDIETKKFYMEEIMEIVSHTDSTFYDNYPDLLYALFESDPKIFLQKLVKISGDYPDGAISTSLTKYGKEQNALESMRSTLKDLLSETDRIDGHVWKKWNELMAVIGYEQYVGTDVEENVMKMSGDIFEKMKTEELSKVEEYVHPEKGVKFVTSASDSGVLTLSKEEIGAVESVDEQMEEDNQSGTQERTEPENVKNLLTLFNSDVQIHEKYFNPIHEGELNILYEEFPNSVYVEYHTGNSVDSVVKMYRIIFDILEDDWFLVAVLVDVVD